MATPASAPARRGRRLLLLVLLVMTAAAAAHLRALSADVLFDDVEIARLHPALDSGIIDVLTRPWWPQPDRDRLWRPLPLLSFALQDGGSSRSLHLVNLLLHALVSAAVLALGVRLSGETAGTVAGLLFAVHPLTSETVTFLVGRADLMSAAAILAALLLAASRMRDPARLTLLAGCAFFACLAKENGFVLPLLLPLVLRATGRPPLARRQIPVWLATLLPAAGALLLRVMVLGSLMRQAPPPFGNNPLAHAPWLDARAQAVRLMGHALGLFAWPHPLSVDYSHAAITVPPLGPVGGVAVLAGLTAAVAVLWLSRARPALFAGLIFFPAAHLLTCNMLFPIGTIFAERLLYLPMVGLCLAAGDLAVALRERSPAPLRHSATVLFLALLVLLGGLTWRREAIFADDLGLWRATVESVPRSAKARYNLGRSLAARQRHAEAAVEYEEATRIDPTHVQALNNLGSSRLRAGNIAGALAALDRARESAPRSATVAFNRAQALQQAGRLEEARREFRRGMALDPAQGADLATRDPWRGIAP